MNISQEKFQGGVIMANQKKVKETNSIKKVAKTKSKVKDMIIERDGIDFTFIGIVDTESKVITEAYCVEFYVRDVLNGVICMNVLMQRTEDQWTTYLKSKLIEAILKGRPIGNILVAERNQYTRNYEDNSLLDGLQRTAAIIGFVNNEYRLSKNIPSINCRYSDENGNIIETTYQLAGRKFEQLPETLRRKFLRYQLTVCYYKNFTDEELDEIMLCVNSGKAPTAYQKMRFALGSDNMSIIQPMCDSPLWEELLINARNDSVLACIMRTIMLMSYKTEGGFSVASMNKFIGNYRDKLSTELLQKINNLIEQLSEIKYDMSDDEISILDGCNIPHLIAILNRFNDMNKKGKNSNNRTFLDFFRAFVANKESDKFFAYKIIKNKEDNEFQRIGSGGTQYSADSIDEREDIINDFFDDFFDTPLIETDKNSNVNTNLEVKSNVETKTEQNSETDIAGETEYTDRSIETEDNAVLNANNPDMQGNFEGGRDTGGDRLKNEAEYRETKILSGDSVQIGIAVPFNSGHNDIHECVQAGQQTQ